MGIFKDIKKGLKGSKAYQEGKAKRKAKRAKSPLGKAVKRVAKDVKSAVKGSKEYQAGKAKKKAGKSWTKAVKKQKKSGGSSMNELIKARHAAKASGNKSAYAAAQNQINKAYGSKKVHKAAPKKREDIGQTDESIGQTDEKKYAQGGKVENNPFGWPSSDSRNR